MSASRQLEAPSGIKPADIYFVLFRHKWKILILTLLGVGLAAGIFFTQKPMYQSDAELFIKYVTDVNARAVNGPDNGASTTSQLDQNQNMIMNSEIAMLTSLDLAKQVVTNIGAEKILAKIGGGKDVREAAFAIRNSLKVEPIRESCVLYVTFRHADPDMVGQILADLIQDYQEMHAKVHGIGIPDETLTDDETMLRSQIADTETQLRIAKTNAGIVSVADAEKSYENEMSDIRHELLQAKIALAGHHVTVRDPASTPAPKSSAAAASDNVPQEEMAHYKYLCQQLTYLDRKQNEFIQQGYTEGSKLVQDNRDRQDTLTKSKTALEKKFPSLLDVDTSGPINEAPAGSNLSDADQIAALTLKIKGLQAQYDQIQAEAVKLNEVESKISDLEDIKKHQQEKYDLFVKMRDTESINDTIGPGRANILLIQQPSFPYKSNNKLYKALAGLSVGGLILGLAWAFLIEFYFDRSVKRPVDLQGRLHIPFFLSIPDLRHGPRSRLNGAERKQLAYNGNGHDHGIRDVPVTNGALVVASPAVNHALSSHYDALRDRLVSYFESINLTRKPKLVAITSAGKGAGVSTISAGLAASLSETGDGRVLLVDMNLENGAAQQFIHGQPGCQLDDALATEKRDHALVQENLYVVSEGSNADKLPRVLPKRFSSLIPKLRASDYDYIIFDMPPVTQTSVTTRLAGFMDTVMLVIESEKTDRDVVQQAHQLLVQSKANVTAVLNKTRNYIPARLQADIHADI